MHSAHFRRISCWLLSFILIGSAIRQAQAIRPETDEENRVLYSSFASGHKFYLESGSFEATGNGKLQYTVTSETGQGAQRVSRNEIDCTTGQFKSPIESWQEDSDGKISDSKSGPVVTMSLRQKTQLYRTLKDACRENLPQLPMNW